MILKKQLEKMGIDFLEVGSPQFENLGLIIESNVPSLCSFIAGKEYIPVNFSDNISALLVTKEISDEIGSLIPHCVVERPREVFFKLHNLLSSDEVYVGERFKTEIHNSADISSLSSIAKNNVKIGKNCVIEEFVTIRENVTIGDNVTIRAGSIIGGEGFEFKSDSIDDSIFLVKHLGMVVIGNNVEIQYNSCIDKAIYPWDKTVIGDNVKIDNLVHVAHAVKIDSNSMIVANSGIGGRVVIGKNTWIGLGAQIRNGIKIGNNSRANMGSIVTKSIGEGESVSGNFAVPHEQFIEMLRRK